MNPTVLIVDDSELIRRMIRRTLRITGLDIGDIHEASNGLEALEQLGREKVDLLLVDLKMPEMSGSELIRRLAADGLLQRHPVIVVSGEPDDDRMDELRAMGIAGVLSKPFTVAELRRAVQGALVTE